MHGRGIKRILAAWNSQKTRSLLECLGPQTRYRQKYGSIGECSVCVAIGHNGLGLGSGKSGHTLQERCRGRIDVHSHSVDAVFNHSIELAREFALIDVVLILPYADCLGIDLDKFGKRILQTARNGNGSAIADIQIRKFCGSCRRGRVHRCSSLTHHNFRKPQLRMLG